MHRPQTAQRDDEVFDVVDEQDRVVGQATRAEVHARRLLHRATHVLVFDRAGKVFLQKRSMLKDSAPGCWDSSCSGHLDRGEDYLTAAVRELREEIGVTAEPGQLRLHLQLPPSVETGWEFVAVFSLRYEGPIVTNPAEIERGEWFAPEELSAALAQRPAEFTKPLKLHWARVHAEVLRPGESTGR
jgi:isopentenyl-diphosphate delta-isomerase type 1